MKAGTSLSLSPNFAHTERWGYYRLIKYSIKTDSPKREVPFAQVLSELQQPSLVSVMAGLRFCSEQKWSQNLFNI